MIYIVEALLVQGKVQYGWAELSNLDVLCEGSHLLRKSSGQKVRECGTEGAECRDS